MYNIILGTIGAMGNGASKFFTILFLFLKVPALPYFQMILWYHLAGNKPYKLGTKYHH